MVQLTPVLEAALAAVGELLEAEEAEAAIVVVGGATLNLLRLLERTTDDVDLVVLAPTDDELAEAAEWVQTQDASEHFPALVAEMVEHVRDSRGHR
jgi:hypothetical protein